jgi:hypothetical protein
MAAGGQQADADRVLERHGLGYPGNPQPSGAWCSDTRLSFLFPRERGTTAWAEAAAALGVADVDWRAGQIIARGQGSCAGRVPLRTGAGQA